MRPNEPLQRVLEGWVEENGRSDLLVPAEFKFVGALLVLIVVLLIRPQGLLGKAQRIG